MRGLQRVQSFNQSPARLVEIGWSAVARAGVCRRIAAVWQQTEAAPDCGAEGLGPPGRAGALHQLHHRSRPIRRSHRLRAEGGHRTSAAAGPALRSSEGRKRRERPGYHLSMPGAPKPTAVVGTPRRAEARLTAAQESELLVALRFSPGPHEAQSKRVSRQLVELGLLADGDGSRYRLTAAGREMAGHLFAARVISAATARRMAAAKRKALSRVPADWPFPESHHAW
jgi:hypothetical protein